MGISDWLKNKNENKQMQHENINENNRQSKIILERQSIDETGKPYYENIELLKSSDEVLITQNGMKQISSYYLNAPELIEDTSEGKCNNTLAGRKVYADIDDKRLQNDKEYQQWVAQLLFSKDRTQKIFSKYEGYAGGLNLDQNGNLCYDQNGNTKYVDKTVIEALKLRRQELVNRIGKQVGAREIREQDISM